MPHLGDSSPGMGRDMLWFAPPEVENPSKSQAVLVSIRVRH